MKKTFPSLSIVTPSYNQGKYLEKTIRSVLSQSVPATEYFVMDGGSADASRDVILAYKNRLTGWVSEPDQGQAHAINKGFSLASGDIFAWINSDDFYLPGAFETVLTVFAAHPEVDLVYGDVLSVNEAGDLMNVMTFAPYTLQDLMTFRIISQPAVFFRRSAWERAGGMDQSYHYLLDHQLWLHMLMEGEMMYFPCPLAAARFYPEAKNRAHAEKFGSEARRIVKWMRKEPDFFPYPDQLKKKMDGGADWLDANYLSNGEHPWQSLRQYARAARHHSARVWEDRNRLLLTILMAVSPALARKVFEQRAVLRLESLQKYQFWLREGKPNTEKNV